MTSSTHTHTHTFTSPQLNYNHATKDPSLNKHTHTHIHTQTDTLPNTVRMGEFKDFKASKYVQPHSRAITAECLLHWLLLSSLTDEGPNRAANLHHNTGSPEGHVLIACVPSSRHHVVPTLTDLFVQISGISKCLDTDGCIQSN